MDLPGFNAKEKDLLKAILDLEVRNLAYIQILEQTLLNAIYKDQGERDRAMEEARVRADAQAKILYKYIFENYGDVGLDELLDNDSKS